MKHLIRNTATRKYFGHSDWTTDISQAQQFNNPLSAISFSIQNNLKNAELVLLSGRELSANDIRISLPAQ